jgi:hypothetical protein
MDRPDLIKMKIYSHKLSPVNFCGTGCPELFDKVLNFFGIVISGF